jgi:hypothetical protein
VHYDSAYSRTLTPAKNTFAMPRHGIPEISVPPASCTRNATALDWWVHAQVTVLLPDSLHVTSVSSLTR